MADVCLQQVSPSGASGRRLRRIWPDRLDNLCGGITRYSRRLQNQPMTGRVLAHLGLSSFKLWCQNPGGGELQDIGLAKGWPCSGILEAQVVQGDGVKLWCQGSQNNKGRKGIGVERHPSMSSMWNKSKRSACLLVILICYPLCVLLFSFNSLCGFQLGFLYTRIPFSRSSCGSECWDSVTSYVVIVAEQNRYIEEGLTATINSI